MRPLPAVFARYTTADSGGVAQRRKSLREPIGAAPRRRGVSESANVGTKDTVNTIVVNVRSASRVHRSGTTRVLAIDAVSLQLVVGDAVAVVGPSGAGKTTLLNLISGLDRPTTGHVSVLGHELERMSERLLTKFRATSVGMVFQDSYLLPGLTALENVTAAGTRWRNRRQLAEEASTLLEAVGLADRMDFPPNRLSGGERQRVGIARAMLGSRPLLVADEPTGNLDSRTTQELLDLFDELRETRNVTLAFATHDPLVADRLPRRLELREGRMAS
jgi:ABC-type lipoprotein export system ATPase subunit